MTVRDWPCIDGERDTFAIYSQTNTHTGLSTQNRGRLLNGFLFLS